MPEKTYAKVVLNGTTYVDLTSDTVDPSTLLAGYTAHDRSGALITGTFDSSIFVLKAGDTMTGPLILSGAPTENLHAATKKYVDDNIPTALADLSDDSTHRLVTDLATGRWDQILKKAQSKGAGYNYVQDSFELKTIDTSTASTPYRARYTLESDAVNYMNSDVKTGGFTVSFKYKAVKNASQNLRLTVAIEPVSGSSYTRQSTVYSITTYSTSWNTLKLQLLGTTSTTLTTANFRYLSFKLNNSDNGTLTIKDVRLEIGENTNLIGPYAWSEYDEKRYTRRYIGNQASKITANNDLNSLGMLKPGYFICETDTIAASVTNCPTQKAFWLETFNFSYVEQPSEYYYIVQKIVEYTSDPPNMYIRRHKFNSTAGTVSSGSWFKILTDYVDRVTSGDANNLFDSRKNLFSITEVSDTCSNVPNSEYGYIISMKGSDTNYASQLYISEISNLAYFRRYSAGSWRTWQPIISGYTSGNLQVNTSGASLDEVYCKQYGKTVNVRAWVTGLSTSTQTHTNVITVQLVDMPTTAVRFVFTCWLGNGIAAYAGYGVMDTSGRITLVKAVANSDKASFEFTYNV